MQRPKIELEPNSHGGLLVWREPEPGRAYVVASDTAAGLAKGDFAAAVVLDGETCALVARWKERENPHTWGARCALLAWWYNEALLAFETFPSAHGVTAANEAVRLGYRRLYKRIRMDTISRKTSEVLGWHTNSTTKPQMIDRVKRAFEEGVEVPDEDLLMEAREQRWNEKGEMTGRRHGHDDLLIAFSIGLMVRDQSWVAGQLRPEKRAPSNESERYWMRLEEKLKRQEKQKSRSAIRLKPPWMRS